MYRWWPLADILQYKSCIWPNASVAHLCSYHWCKHSPFYADLQYVAYPRHIAQCQGLKRNQAYTDSMHSFACTLASMSEVGQHIMPVCHHNRLHWTFTETRDSHLRCTFCRQRLTNNTEHMSCQSRSEPCARIDMQTHPAKMVLPACV